MRQPFFIFITILAADQISKYWVRAELVLFEVRELIPGLFNLVYFTNTGAAFGLLAGDNTIGRRLFFVGVTLLALLLIFILYRQVRDQGRLPLLALTLIAAGAVGNLIDRVIFGAVTDFLDFYWRGYHWPAFNVADSAITVGVVLFLVASWRQRPVPPT
ncbi:MAG: signal peptidase II [Desulfobulbaceae bacterium]|nr:MAG: signal peptidase II [Desulfobulbaceae bacterium]